MESSIKFFAESSSKQGIHYLDHCIVLTSIKGIPSLCLCWFVFWAKPTYNVLFWTFNNKLHFSESFASVSKHIHMCLLYGFSIKNNFWNKIHTVHTFLCMKLIRILTGISGASLCSLPMVVSLMGGSGDSIDDLCVVFFTMLIFFLVTKNIIIKGVQMKKIGAHIEVECRAKGQREGYNMPPPPQGLA